MTSINDLPPEILMQIFGLYAETEKQKNLLDVISKVCISWGEICSTENLWIKFDGTLTYENMMHLARKGCLNHTKELILSETDKLQTKDVEHLFKGVKNIEVISFAKVKHITEKTLTILAQNCPKINKIQIGHHSGSISLGYEMLVSFFSARGCGIVTIDLSHCRIVNFSMCLRCICDCCPNLQYLHIMSIRSDEEIFFLTKYVQLHCPKLKGLYLDQTVKLTQEKHPAGFPDLQEFSYYDYECRVYYDEEFGSILFNSPELKLLSLTNCCESFRFLLTLPCSVKYLYLPKSVSVCSSEILCDVLAKWSYCLKEVDISHAKCVPNQAILNLVTRPVESPLECLILNFTVVTLDVVQKIIENCQQLSVLKLEECKYVFNGMNRAFNSKSEIADLLERVKVYIKNHPLPVDYPLHFLMESECKRKCRAQLLKRYSGYLAFADLWEKRC